MMWGILTNNHDLFFLQPHLIYQLFFPDVTLQNHLIEALSMSISRSGYISRRSNGLLAGEFTRILHRFMHIAIIIYKSNHRRCTSPSPTSLTLSDLQPTINPSNPLPRNALTKSTFPTLFSHTPQPSTQPHSYHSPPFHRSLRCRSQLVCLMIKPRATCTDRGLEAHEKMS